MVLGGGISTKKFRLIKAMRRMRIRIRSCDHQESKILSFKLQMELFFFFSNFSKYRCTCYQCVNDTHFWEICPHIPFCLSQQYYNHFLSKPLTVTSLLFIVHDSVNNHQFPNNCTAMATAWSSDLWWLYCCLSGPSRKHVFMLQLFTSGWGLHK